MKNLTIKTNRYYIVIIFVRQSKEKVFVDFRKTNGSIRRDIVCSIINDFGLPENLIKLTRTCIEETKNRVKVDIELPSPFVVNTELKQRIETNSLSSVLFNLALEKELRTF